MDVDCWAPILQNIKYTYRLYLSKYRLTINNLQILYENSIQN